MAAEYAHARRRRHLRSSCSSSISPPRPPLPAVLLALLAATVVSAPAGGVDVLSKSQVQRCALDSGAGGRLSCDRKLVLNLAIPSGSSGGEASMVAHVVQAEENGTQKMQTVRDPPVITIEKTAAYAIFALTYLKDVAYRPEEQYVTTRKCEPDAGGDVVGSCARLWDNDGKIIPHTEPICCPCGPNRRVPSSCGNVFDKMIKGKANTAHCLRFPGDWFHVWAIGARSIRFSIRVQVNKGSSVSDVVVSPENRTVVSGDNFLRVNIVGDYAGYTSIPTFEGFYLVTPQKGAGGKPPDLGDEYGRWMLLERACFAVNKLDCNKIGVGFEAFRNQPNFCSSPFGNCLNDQLWHYWESDKNRENQTKPPEFVVEGRFQRINQHPGAGGSDAFSVGVTEALNTNLLVELSADDIEYVYQRSPGKITSVNVPTFEALSQVGTAKVTIKNVGELEASYSLTFNCLSGISPVEEQFFIMKPDEVSTRSFDLHASTSEASQFRCTAILKGSDFSELDRAECQFSTTATILNNGTQIPPSTDHKKGGFWGFIAAVGKFFRTLWDSVLDFFTGRSCRTKCLSLFDFSCHIQYICIGWMVMFCLMIATVLAAVVLLWLLHQKGFFDHLYDWWEDVFGTERHGGAHRGRRRGHHRHHHSHRHHGGHPHRHKSGHDHHHHHHVHHRHGEQPKPAAEGDCQHRHDPALAVHHAANKHKHRHGKAADGAEHRERRRYERHAAEHGQHGHERHHSRAVEEWL